LVINIILSPTCPGRGFLLNTSRAANWRRKKSRPEIDKLACRANPIQRAKYITASTWHQDVQKWQHINGN